MIYIIIFQKLLEMINEKLYLIIHLLEEDGGGGEYDRDDSSGVYDGVVARELIS